MSNAKAAADEIRASIDAAFGIVVTETPGCGARSMLGDVCTTHVTDKHFDGFTKRWHADVHRRGRTMWPIEN